MAAASGVKVQEGPVPKRAKTTLSLADYKRKTKKAQELKEATNVKERAAKESSKNTVTPEVVESSAQKEEQQHVKDVSKDLVVGENNNLNIPKASSDTSVQSPSIISLAEKPAEVKSSTEIGSTVSSKSVISFKDVVKNEAEKPAEVKSSTEIGSAVSSKSVISFKDVVKNEALQIKKQAIVGTKEKFVVEHQTNISETKQFVEEQHKQSVQEATRPIVPAQYYPFVNTGTPFVKVEKPVSEFVEEQHKPCVVQEATRPVQYHSVEKPQFVEEQHKQSVQKATRPPVQYHPSVNTGTPCVKVEKPQFVEEQHKPYLQEATRPVQYHSVEKPQFVEEQHKQSVQKATRPLVQYHPSVNSEPPCVKVEKSVLECYTSVRENPCVPATKIQNVVEMRQMEKLVLENIGIIDKREAKASCTDIDVTEPQKVIALIKEIRKAADEDTTEEVAKPMSTAQESLPKPDSISGELETPRHSFDGPKFVASDFESRVGLQIDSITVVVWCGRLGVKEKDIGCVEILSLGGTPKPGPM